MTAVEKIVHDLNMKCLKQEDTIRTLQDFLERHVSLFDEVEYAKTMYEANLWSLGYAMEILRNSGMSELEIAEVFRYDD